MRPWTICSTQHPAEPSIRQFIKGDRQNARDPKRRERNKDGALAYAIARIISVRLRALLRDAGYKDAQTRAAEYARRPLAQDHRSKIVAARASPVAAALTMWLRRHRGGDKKHPENVTPPQALEVFRQVMIAAISTFPEVTRETHPCLRIPDHASDDAVPALDLG